MANQNNKDKPLLCNFCGKSQDEVERMIIGPGVNICNECIELCASLLGEEGIDVHQPKPRRQAPRATRKGGRADQCAYPRADQGRA